ncbi:MAG: hypothetical protein R3F45_01360 [Gammaproteobacteria bacterium]
MLLLSRSQLSEKGVPLPGAPILRGLIPPAMAREGWDAMREEIARYVCPSYSITQRPFAWRAGSNERSGSRPAHRRRASRAACLQAIDDRVMALMQQIDPTALVA